MFWRRWSSEQLGRQCSRKLRALRLRRGRTRPVTLGCARLRYVYRELLPAGVPEFLAAMFRVPGPALAARIGVSRAGRLRSSEVGDGATPHDIDADAAGG